MWFGRNSLALGVGAIMAIGACGGPLDSPTPPPPHDAAADVARDLGVDRRPSGIGGSAGTRDASVVPDAGQPDISQADAGRDADASGLGPVIPGCVTGVEPSPALVPVNQNSFVIGCGQVSRMVAHLVDLGHQGVVFQGSLDPPVQGFAVTSGALCADATDAPIFVDATGTGGVPPGGAIVSTVVVDVLGPEHTRFVVGPIRLVVTSTNFTLDPDVVDFGVVPVGAFPSIAIAVNNDSASAPFSSIYPIPTISDPFQLAGTLWTPSSPSSQTLEPGGSAPFLTASLDARVPGSYEATFIVSPFAPGVPVDPSCGVIRSLTLRAQVNEPGPP